jgi:hypothetical protein
MSRRLFWLWGRGQAIAWYLLAALLHGAFFRCREDDTVVLTLRYLFSLAALAGGYIVTKACLEYARKVDREFAGDDRQ